ncbi:hypothetical protein LTR87_012661 [Friedmanniomyces endolithicus]|nr:hypothetical protein LTR87_012661 [Friedmanniomyces endolithicus]
MAIGATPPVRQLELELELEAEELLKDDEELLLLVEDNDGLAVDEVDRVVAEIDGVAVEDADEDVVDDVAETVKLDVHPLPPYPGGP